MGCGALQEHRPWAPQDTLPHTGTPCPHAQALQRGRGWWLYLHLEDQLVATNTELRLKEDSELLLRHRLSPAAVRALDPLQGLQGHEG